MKKKVESEYCKIKHIVDKKEICSQQVVERQVMGHAMAKIEERENKQLRGAEKMKSQSILSFAKKTKEINDLHHHLLYRLCFFCHNLIICEKINK